MSNVIQNLLRTSIRWKQTSGSTDRLFAATNFRIMSTTTSSSAFQREFILTERVGTKGNIGLVTLNRPKALNALSDKLMIELKDAIDEFQKDSQIGAIIITGKGKSFAAGADIKEMSKLSFAKVFKDEFPGNWLRAFNYPKPIIAAVNGIAFGGGCELTMLCDIAYASENATFSQPEILLGTIPAGGATQNIPRFAGKSRAMEICLTGNRFSAQEAEKMGLVSRVFPSDKLLPETLKIAEKIASNSKIIVTMIKEAVNGAYEATLQEGLQSERRFANATFATYDRKEGMTAFVEKRSPNFKDK